MLKDKVAHKRKARKLKENGFYNGIISLCTKDVRFIAKCQIERSIGPSNKQFVNKLIARK